MASIYELIRLVLPELASPNRTTLSTDASTPFRRVASLASRRMLCFFVCRRCNVDDFSSVAVDEEDGKSDRLDVLSALASGGIDSDLLPREDPNIYIRNIFYYFLFYLRTGTAVGPPLRGRSPHIVGLAE